MSIECDYRLKVDSTESILKLRKDSILIICPGRTFQVETTVKKQITVTLNNPTWLYNFAWFAGDDQVAAVEVFQRELEAAQRLRDADGVGDK